MPYLWDMVALRPQVPIDILQVLINHYLLKNMIYFNSRLTIINTKWHWFFAGWMDMYMYDGFWEHAVVALSLGGQPVIPGA